MEFIDAIKITNKERLIAEGYDIRGILQTTIEAFAEQIFVTGFVHADPHPGNIFVRTQGGKTQIVILDFGLCFPLTE